MSDKKQQHMAVILVSMLEGLEVPQEFSSFQPHDLSFQTLPDALSGIRGFKIKIQETNMQPSHSLLKFSKGRTRSSRMRAWRSSRLHPRFIGNKIILGLSIMVTVIIFTGCSKWTISYNCSTSLGATGYTQLFKFLLNLIN